MKFQRQVKLKIVFDHPFENQSKTIWPSVILFRENSVILGSAVLSQYTHAFLRHDTDDNQ